MAPGFQQKIKRLCKDRQNDHAREKEENRMIHLELQKNPSLSIIKIAVIITMHPEKSKKGSAGSRLLKRTKYLLFRHPLFIIKHSLDRRKLPYGKPVPTRKMNTICYYYDVSALSQPERFAQGLAALPWEERRERILRYRFDRDRLLSLGAGLLATYALREAGAEDLTLSYGEQGKPALLFHPDLHFNLSHSGTLAVCAVSDRPVGADVETLNRAKPAVARRCFQPRELEWMERSLDWDRAFTRLWTRKESYLKQLGTGLAREMDSFSVLPGEPMENGAVFTEAEISGHLICVCTAGQKAEIIEWDPAAQETNLPGAER